MAKPLKYIAADIINQATSGSNPVDFKIPERQIRYWIKQYRSTFISQAIDKRQDISDVWVQPIQCLALIEVDKSECCEIETDCKILRTELQIPNTVETKRDNLIIRVLKPNGESISKTNLSASKYASHSKYTGSSTKWYLKNDYIYIIDGDMLETITIYGVFDDPEELAAYTACDGSTCYNENTSFPCSLKMAEMIADVVYKKKVIPYIQTPQDNTNDANNNITLPSK